MTKQVLEPQIRKKRNEIVSPFVEANKARCYLQFRIGKAPIYGRTIMMMITTNTTIRHSLSSIVTTTSHVSWRNGHPRVMLCPSIHNGWCTMTQRTSMKRALRMLRTSTLSVSCWNDPLPMSLWNTGTGSSDCYDRTMMMNYNGRQCRWASDFTNKMRHSTQQSDANTQRDLIHMADTLLNLQKYPIGTYTHTEYSKVKIILYYYIHLEKPSCKEAVNHPFDVLVRLAQEVAFMINIHKHTDETTTTNDNEKKMIQRELGDDVSSRAIPNTLATTSNPATYEWILNANYYNPIFNKWKNLSLSAKDRIPGMYSGLDLIQKIQYMSKILPPTIFKVNIITITMILQVVIKQVRRDEAPIICERLLQLMSQQFQKQKEMAATTTATSYNTNRACTDRELQLFEPNIYSYNILLKAWAESRLDVASDKISLLLQEMKDDHNLELGLVSHKLLLRFYSRLGNVDQVNVILQQMHAKQLPMDVDCLTQALNCCCRANQMDNAHTIFNMILHQHPNTAERTKAVQECIHHMLLGYRKRLDTVLPALAEEGSVARPYSSKLSEDDYRNTRHKEKDDGMAASVPTTSSADVDNNPKAMEATQQSPPPPQQGSNISEVVQNTIQRLQDFTNVVKVNQMLNSHSLGKIYTLCVALTLVSSMWLNSQKIFLLIFFYFSFLIMVTKWMFTYGLDSMFQMMLELYIRANLLTNARELVKTELPRSIEAQCYLLKAYCDHNQVQVATRMLYDLLQENNKDDPKTGITPNIQMFNIVMEAWGKSKNIDDAYEQMSMLYDTLKNHPKCRHYKIRPNKYTYLVLLESLISLEVPDGAVKAEAILGEMEQTYNQILFSDNPNEVIDVNELVKPDIDIYMIVMKAWIQSSDCDRALDILRRMEQFTSIVPDKQMYYDLLNYYAKVGSEKAAESATQVFQLMKATHEPQFHSYCLLNRAWLKSGSPKAADQLWLLYHEMTEKYMRPDPPLYLQLIQSLTAKKELKYIRKAQIILNDIEEHNRKYLVPTYYTMMIMAYLELDEVDFAIEMLSKFVHNFGHRDHQLVPIMTQLIKLWIDKGEYKKATILVNTMQEFTDAGLLQEGVQCDVFELLKTAWESSNDPDKDFIIEQIDDIIRHISERRTFTATAMTTSETDTDADHSRH